MENSSLARMASEHDKEMRAQFAQYIRVSVSQAKHLTGEKNLKYRTGRMGTPEIVLTQTDSVDAAIAEGDGKTAILCEADFFEPAKGIMSGGKQNQEISLSLCSTLYQVCSDKSIIEKHYAKNKKKDTSYSLYDDSILYVPKVVFAKKEATPHFFDVIMCTAPNWQAARRAGASDYICTESMRSRIRAILAAAEKEKVNTLILHAFGCQNLSCDPRRVVRLFLEELEGYRFKVVFAVPGYKYCVFEEEIFKEKA